MITMQHRKAFSQQWDQPLDKVKGTQWWSCLSCLGGRWKYLKMRKFLPSGPFSSWWPEDCWRRLRCQQLSGWVFSIFSIVRLGLFNRRQDYSQRFVVDIFLMQSSIAGEFWVSIGRSFPQDFYVYFQVEPGEGESEGETGREIGSNFQGSMICWNFQGSMTCWYL